LVDDMREKIKQFLAAQGMLKGTPGSGARHSEQPSKLRLTEGDYSSSSASPPTPVSVLSEELHPTLTISSERDEPYPSSLNSSYREMRSVQTLSPDTEYPPRGGLFRDEDPMLSHAFTPLPPLPSNSLVTFPVPWYDPTRYPPQSFPSPAMGSTFSSLYASTTPFEGPGDVMSSH